MKLSLLAATILASGSFCCGHAVAAEAAEGAVAGAPETTTLDEVIVTSSRRETQLQTTPAAISAYSGSALQAKGIDSIEGLGAANPSMHVSSFQGEAQIYIRGIGYSSVVGGSDSSTALYSDGVYLSRPAAALPAFLDVARVEVLRGPQGTLYGRNATGGSVNIISNNPTDRFEYEGSALVGDYSRFRLTGIVSGPISDKVSARLAVQRERRDGYTTLLRTTGDPLSKVQQDAEDKDDWMGRLTVVAKPTDTLTATFKADYYEADDAAVVWHYFGPGTQTNPVFQALVPISARAEPFSRTIPSDVEHFNKPVIWGVSGKLDWSLGRYTLSSLTAYRETKPKNRDDLDGSAIFGTDQFRSEDQHQFSQELQLSSPAEDRLSWIVGAYYFTESNKIRNEYFLPFVETLFGLPPDPVCCLLKLNGSTTTDAWAVYGEANYDVTDRLQVVVGGRYSSETRGGSNDVVLENAPATIFDNVAQFDDTRFTAFTPKFGVNYRVNPDTFVYATVSKGFKSGGFNPGSYQNTPFQPEKIWDYEGGVKTSLFDRRLRANLAGFFYDYTDLQVQDVAANNVVIRNAAAAKVKGVEVEAAWLVSEHFQLDGSFAWLDAKFTDGALLDPKFPALGVQPLDGRTLPKAPRYKAAIGAQYQTAFANGLLTLRGDWEWQDKIYFSAFNVPDLTQGSYGWAKARVSWSNPTDTWRVSAFIDNITDEVVSTNRVYDGDIIGSSVFGNLAPPRTFGLEFTVKN